MSVLSTWAQSQDREFTVAAKWKEHLRTRPELGSDLSSALLGSCSSYSLKVGPVFIPLSDMWVSMEFEKLTEGRGSL